MSRETVKTLVENIYNSKYDTLKEDLAKVVSGKAMNVLESKKTMVGKKFFKEPIDEAFWYHTTPVEGGAHKIVKINNPKNPYKHKVGDVVKPGEHTLRQYSSDGSAYGEAPASASKF